MAYKFFEIRDRATFVPAIAIETTSLDTEESYLLKRAGYSPDIPLVLLILLETQECKHSPHDWVDKGRTISVAHKYIAENFEKLGSGDVVDVEFILGEKDSPCVQEIYEVIKGN